MSSQARATGQETGSVMVADRYRIHPDQRLPALDAPGGVKAFNVTDERGAPKALFALVCRADIAPRSEVLSQFSRFNRLPMTAPLRWGVVYWPPQQARRFVIIMHQPGGERVLEAPDATMEPWREDRVVRTMMQPLLPMFKELGGRLLTHRAIRADNLYFTDATRETVMLGECFSSPPGFAQPSIYEPIDSAMAMPEGRGHGTQADDYYALGVLALVLICGGDPVSHLSEQEVIDAKITRGSYGALVGDTRLSLPMVEMLRGLLCDDPDERWRHDDVLLWLNGRHLSPKQALLPPKAARPFVFEGQEYNNASALSNAMGCNWQSALRVIRGNELERWIRRSLSDDQRAAAVGAESQAAIGLGTSTTGSHEDRLLSRILIALDTRAPLRFKQVAARIEGLATAFAVNYHDENRRQVFAELFKHRLPQSWIESQPQARAETLAIARSYDLALMHMGKPRIGYGLERALYYLNPAWPCQSPLLQSDYVAELSDLLPAFEHLAREGRTERPPIDWHIAGFISACMKASPDRAFSELSSDEDPAVSNLGLVRLMAEVQQAAGPAQLPYFAAWCADLLQPMVQTFKNRHRREQLTALLKELAREGNLAALVEAVDNPDRQAADEEGYRRARAEFAALVEQMRWLRNGGLTKPSIVRAHAREASTIAASVIAAVGVLLITLTSVF